MVISVKKCLYAFYEHPADDQGTPHALAHSHRCKFLGPVSLLSIYSLASKRAKYTFSGNIPFGGNVLMLLLPFCKWGREGGEKERTCGKLWSVVCRFTTDMNTDS